MCFYRSTVLVVNSQLHENIYVSVLLFFIASFMFRERKHVLLQYRYKYLHTIVSRRKVRLLDTRQTT